MVDEDDCILRYKFFIRRQQATALRERRRERKRGTIGGKEKRRQEKKREDKTIYIHTFIKPCGRNIQKGIQARENKKHLTFVAKKYNIYK